MKVSKTIGLIVLVVMLVGVLLGTACGTQGPQGVQGPKGDKGDPGNFAWGTSFSVGPTESGAWFSPNVTVPLLHLEPGDRVSYVWNVTQGFAVNYWLHDPYGNAILIGNADNDSSSPLPAFSGQGDFIVASSGNYSLCFVSTGPQDSPYTTDWRITYTYTIYPIPGRSWASN